MLEIVDKTAEVAKFDKRVTPTKLSQVNLLVVHRIDKELEGRQINGAADVAEAFSLHPEYKTGLQMPYNFIVRQDGVCEQALAVTDAGMHSLKYNHTSIGLALIGDFRKHPPTEAQLDALQSFCFMWVQNCWARGIFLPVSELIKGHDELPSGSVDSGKACPGKHLDMDELREDVASKLTGEMFAVGVLK